MVSPSSTCESMFSGTPTVLFGAKKRQPPQKRTTLPFFSPEGSPKAMLMRNGCFWRHHKPFSPPVTHQERQTGSEVEYLLKQAEDALDKLEKDPQAHLTLGAGPCHGRMRPTLRNKDLQETGFTPGGGGSSSLRIKELPLNQQRPAFFVWRCCEGFWGFLGVYRWLGGVDVWV